MSSISSSTQNVAVAQANQIQDLAKSLSPRQTVEYTLSRMADPAFFALDMTDDLVERPEVIRELGAAVAKFLVTCPEGDVSGVDTTGFGKLAQVDRAVLEGVSELVAALFPASEPSLKTELYPFIKKNADLFRVEGQSLILDRMTGPVLAMQPCVRQDPGAFLREVCDSDWTFNFTPDGFDKMAGAFHHFTKDDPQAHAEVGKVLMFIVGHLSFAPGITFNKCFPDLAFESCRQFAKKMATAESTDSGAVAYRFPTEAAEQMVEGLPYQGIESLESLLQQMKADPAVTYYLWDHQQPEGKAAWDTLVTQLLVDGEDTEDIANLIMPWINDSLDARHLARYYDTHAELISRIGPRIEDNQWPAGVREQVVRKLYDAACVKNPEKVALTDLACCKGAAEISYDKPGFFYVLQGDEPPQTSNLFAFRPSLEDLALLNGHNGPFEMDFPKMPGDVWLVFPGNEGEQGAVMTTRKDWGDTPGSKIEITEKTDVVWTQAS